MSAAKQLVKPAVLGTFLVLAMLGTQASAGQAATPAERKTPVAFVPNVGQTASPVRFLATTANLDLYLTGDEVVFGFTEHDDTPRDPSARSRGGSARKKHEKDTRGNIRMKLVGGQLTGQPVGFDLQRGKSHYLIGNDPSKWHRNVPHYAGVRVPEVYPGVALVFHGENGRIQYDFEVAPGADHRTVEIEFAGAEQADLTPEGDLVLKTRKGELRNLKPRIYQDHEDGRRDVVGRFVRRGQHRMGFEVEAHDASRPLVIDPEVVFYPLFGGNMPEWLGSIAGDAEGNAYVTGETRAFNFPRTGGEPCQPNPPGPPGQPETCFDAFVTKLDPAGAIAYSTYLGGGNVDVGTQVGVDDAGSAYVVGYTASAEFPVQSGNMLACYPHCTYLFIAKLDPSGSDFQFVNLFGDSHDPGGEDYGWTFPEGMAMDSRGSVYVRGLTWTTQFPTTPGVIGPGLQVPRNSEGNVVEQAFVVKFDSAGSLVYATLLPVSEGTTDCYDCIAVDWSGHAYVRLDARSPDLPGGPGVAGTLAVKLNRTATAIEYSTPLPIEGIAHENGGMGVDLDGQLYLAIAEADDPPVVPTIYQYGVHVLKLNAHGSAVLYDTVLPSIALPPCVPGQDVFPSSLPRGLAVEPYGRVFLLAYTYDAVGCNTAIATWMRELSHTGQWKSVLFGNWAPIRLTLGADGNLYLASFRYGSQPDPGGQPQVDIAAGMLPNTIEPDPDPSCRECPNVGEPVNVATGNVFLDQTDIAVPGLRGALVFRRSYNSTTTRDGGFGPGWSHPYEKSLLLRNRKLLMLRDADGVVSYYAGEDGAHFEPSAPINKESWIDAQANGTFVRSLRDGGSETYDDNGRLSAIIDPLGNTTTLEPNADGLLWKIKDPSLRELTLTYTDGHVTELSGPAGSIATYIYGNGKLNSVTYADSTDPAKRSGFGFTYEGEWLGSVRDLAGRTLETHTYYPDGKAFSSAVSGAIEGYTFVYEPNRTTVTDAVGAVVTYEWSEFGGMKRVTRLTRPCSGGGTLGGGCSEAEDWSYDGEGRVATHTDAAGITTRHTYYANGDLHTQTDAAGTASARTTTYSYVYSDTGRITQRTRTAPGQGTLVEDYGPAGPTSIKQTVQSGQDRVVGFTYTAEGLLETATDPRNSNWITTYHYLANGDMDWVEDPKGHRTLFGYDSYMGWRTKVTDPLGSLDDPEHTTTTEYDPLGRVKIVHLPLNAAPTPIRPRRSSRTTGVDSRRPPRILWGG